MSEVCVEMGLLCLCRGLWRRGGSPLRGFVNLSEGALVCAEKIFGWADSVLSNTGLSAMSLGKGVPAC